VEANTWHSLGSAYLGLADHRQAVDCFQRVLGLAADRGDPFNEASALASLGDVYHEQGDRTSARQSWAAARRIFDEISHAGGDKVRAKLR